MGGLLKLCINFNVDSPAPLPILVTSDLITKTYNNIPLETLLISEYHLLSVIYFNFVGTSHPMTSFPILSSTVTMVLFSSPLILRDDSPVPIIVRVICFGIVLLTITMIIVTLRCVCQRYDM